MSLLEVENLSKSFKDKKIIEEFSFSMKPGEIVGLVGPNGAGKTTIMKLLTNLIFPDSGSITIDGHNLLKNREKALNNVSAIIETPGLYKNLTGKDNLKIIQGIRKKPKEELNNIIEYIGLKDSINQKVSRYSLGMKQRLALGMCLLCNPKLLILDEPTNGLDPTGTSEFRELIMTLKEEKNISILFSSHILSEVDKICDRIIFIKDGKIVSSNDIHNNSKKYKIYVEDSKAAKVLIDKAEWITQSSIDKDSILVYMKENNISETLSFLTKGGISFSDIEKIENNTESEYYRIYKETNSND